MYVINQEDHFFEILLQKLRGQTEALYILTRCNNTRFEFIFTNLVSAKIIETYWNLFFFTPSYRTTKKMLEEV